MPDSSTSSQGAASGRCGGGRWWPSAGSPCQAAAAAVGPPSEGRGEAADPLRRDPRQLHGLHGQRLRAAGAGPIQLAGHALRSVWPTVAAGISAY